MEKRVLLAVFLSFLVLIVYQRFLAPPPPPEGVPAAVEQVPPQAAAARAPEARPTQPAERPEPASETRPLVADATEQEVVFENEDVRAVFSNRGAALTSWKLQKYLAAPDVPVDLVPSSRAPETPAGFALTVNDAALSAKIQNVLYHVNDDGLNVGGGQGERRLVFEYQDASLHVRKEFVFGLGPEAYIVSVNAEVTSGGERIPYTIQSGPGLADGDASAGGGNFLAPSYVQPAGGVFYLNDDDTRLATSTLQQTPHYEGTFKYVGIDDQYFLQVALPGSEPVRAQYGVFASPIAGAAPQVNFGVERTSDTPLRYFYGPKDFDQLAAVDRDLVRVINFGIFAPIVVPLLNALKWVNGYVGNYGWSIIILTILINAAIFPLRHRSVVSMRKMQELQPEMKAIQDRYAKLKTTDPARQKMNQEVMALYRERGVNPASGCVPMLLTLPVLFAFYSLLSAAIEIRGAPFVGWIHDLSKHDPYYVTPLLMGATMVWQQRITPTTADPVQQRVMMFMPVMFTFMFLWAPSGLVLYWLVSNLWAIGQQQLTNRLIGSTTTRAPRPAVPEARMKRVGAGKTDQAKAGARQES